jgi:hypothetical protein
MKLKQKSLFKMNKIDEKKKKVLVVVGTQQKGFFLAFIRHLALRCDISIAARGKDVQTLFANHFPGCKVELVKDRSDEYTTERNLIDSCMAAESRYNRTFGMLCSQDRALGYGYLFNATGYPQPERADGPWQRKYASILNELNYYEDLYLRHRFDFVITLAVNRKLWVVCERHKVPCLGLGLVKFGKRLFWTDRPEYTSEYFRSAIRAALTEWQPDGGESKAILEREASSIVSHGRLEIGVFALWRKLCKQISRDIYATLINNRKAGGYRLFAWVPVVCREYKNYRRLLRSGVTPNDLQTRRIVYVPLHLEPEIALLEVSPEFDNTQQLVAWISKSIPADTVVVLREHPHAYGLRPKQYYRRLAQMPNVLFSKPTVQSWDWIACSSLVATITGTTAVEAVYFEKPILSFGKHQLVNELPSVRYVNDFESTRNGILELLVDGIASPVLRCSREVLYKAQLTVSFDMPGFESNYGSSEPADDLAKTAADKLAAQFHI